MTTNKLDLQFTLGFTAAVFFSLLLLTLRILKTDSLFLTFLIWNLFLACIPYIFSYILNRFQLRSLAFYLVFGCWLLFLPNAPYILTDFKHLTHQLSTIVWYDTLLISTFAMNGLLIGIRSIQLVHQSLCKRTSRLLSHLIIIFSLYLSGFGIYLGRVLRWNSWDILNNPFELLTDLIYIVSHPLNNFQAYLYTFAFGTFLITLYYLFPKYTTPSKIQSKI
ncbi:DUF1361 domain-containing protein [Aquimarina brevivitae]|uniref:Putative membrane protein n=1 Tax=Aquimarina brevivitae TaxID=323412 RepID=A0A4Q7NX23_9FLAO|nr:DUF1361 domain-containing protein [Aquimarina brevivitae]RZS91906.1 putative membrane protein [Aquimarina brevivitae]